MKIPYHIPFVSGNELKYIRDVVSNRAFSGDGQFNTKCIKFLKDKYKFENIFLTCNGTAALEIIALLIDIGQGDEIILPSFTYVSTTNVFYKYGAKLVFADSQNNHPNIDPELIRQKITNKTKAIVPVHYGGMSCNMDEINAIAANHNIYVIEDAALGVNSFYNNRILGSMGDFAILSFHDTKHITSGEGGLLIVNNPDFVDRAAVIYENGTNRTDFYLKKVDKYEWKDVGLSCKMSELNSAFLLAQLEQIEFVQQKHKKLFDIYYKELLILEEMNYLKIIRPDVSCNYNYQIFCIVTNTPEERKELQNYLTQNDVETHFHYQSLHNSLLWKEKEEISLPNAENFSRSLLRLPIYPDLSINDVLYITKLITDFFKIQATNYTVSRLKTNKKS